MSLTAYVRYDNNGRIVPGGPIVTKNKPTVGNWQVVTLGTSVTLVGKLRAFVKVNEKAGGYVPGSLFLGKQQPATGKWLEVNASYTGGNTPPTTTTTTTTVPECIEYNVAVPSGGSGTFTWTDCNGNIFGPETITGPFSSTGFCFVSSIITGDVTVTPLGPCR